MQELGVDRSVSGRTRSRAAEVARHVVGGFYLTMAGVHLGIVFADPQTYDGFADAGIFAFVRDGWSEIFMAHPAVWGLCMFAGEATLGTLLLYGGRAARAGWVGVIAFHVLLMLFGLGVWLWAVPALALLVPAAVRDWPQLTTTSSPRQE